MKNEDEVKTQIVTIEKIVPEGKSLARLDGKVVFVWGGLPGEKVEIEIFRNKKSYSEARLLRVIKPSPDRLEPKESHYLTCSPWQVLAYDKQIELKKQLLQEAYTSALRHPSEGWDPEKETAEGLDSSLRWNDGGLVIDKFYESKEKYGYRTKLEFSFTEDEKGQISLAFHKRGANNEYEVIDGCELGSEKMNSAARKITEKLNELEGVGFKGLKSLTIRESKTNHQIIAVIMYKFREYEIDIKLADLDGLVDGLVIAYSTIKSPISVVTELMYQEGVEYLEEQVGGKTIRYPYDGFFQNNLPVFEEALTEIRTATPQVNKITEIYSGTGSIGFNLAGKAKELVGIEIVPSAVEYAGINKELNDITNYTEIEKPDHKIVAEDLEDTNVLVLDPPRSGMHPKLVKRVLEVLPEKIVYLSCNPITQARDFRDLAENYTMMRLVGFDFYPNTPHMESLLVLDKK